eukprot:TRINITY_DN9776_c0_g1_i1.p1 TRINITY_DN9776_c0_g1~~TRINITY_DN9776_c0_g1_i1.p1  ORF type:complete len:648 (+),score=159.16 TRINITY_DN9776_c0_g1_i1:53-1945(+)
MSLQSDRFIRQVHTSSLSDLACLASSLSDAFTARPDSNQSRPQYLRVYGELPSQFKDAVWVCDGTRRYPSWTKASSRTGARARIALRDGMWQIGPVHANTTWLQSCAFDGDVLLWPHQCKRWTSNGRTTSANVVCLDNRTQSRLDDLAAVAAACGKPSQDVAECARAVEQLDTPLSRAGFTCGSAAAVAAAAGCFFASAASRASAGLLMAAGVLAVLRARTVRVLSGPYHRRVQFFRSVLCSDADPRTALSSEALVYDRISAALSPRTLQLGTPSDVRLSGGTITWVRADSDAHRSGFRRGQRVLAVDGSGVIPGEQPTLTSGAALEVVAGGLAELDWRRRGRRQSPVTDVLSLQGFTSALRSSWVWVFGADSTIPAHLQLEPLDGRALAVFAAQLYAVVVAKELRDALLDQRYLVLCGDPVDETDGWECERVCVRDALGAPAVDIDYPETILDDTVRLDVVACGMQGYTLLDCPRVSPTFHSSGFENASALAQHLGKAHFLVWSTPANASRVLPPILEMLERSRRRYTVLILLAVEEVAAMNVRGVGRVREEVERRVGRASSGVWESVLIPVDPYGACLTDDLRCFLRKRLEPDGLLAPDVGERCCVASECSLLSPSFASPSPWSGRRL